MTMANRYVIPPPFVPRNQKALAIGPLLQANRRLATARRALDLSRAAPGRDNSTNWLEAEADVVSELERVRSEADKLAAADGGLLTLDPWVAAERDLRDQDGLKFT
jgi:hypothetical protein